jgi:hypothetical protein
VGILRKLKQKIPCVDVPKNIQSISLGRRQISQQKSGKGIIIKYSECRQRMAKHK